MHISLTPQLESRIKAKVESGLYNNASEVIREALHFTETHEAWIKEIKLDKLRKQLQAGVDQIDRGEGAPFSSKNSLDDLFQDITG